MLCVPCVQDTRMSRVTHRLTKHFCDHLMNSFKKKEDETFGIRALISTILPTHVYPKCIAPTERTMLSWTDFGSWMAKSVHKVFIWDFGLPHVQGKEGVELTDLWHEVWEMFRFNVPKKWQLELKGEDKHFSPSELCWDRKCLGLVVCALDSWTGWGHWRDQQAITARWFRAGG